MSLDEVIRDRVWLVGGKVAGVDCPDCPYQSNDIDIEAHRLTAVRCPDCGARILTAEQKSQLRRAGKL